MPWQRGRYHPVLDVLERLPAEQTTLRLSVSAIATLIGGPLPRTAMAGDFWVSSHTARKNWRRAGWTARLDWRDGVVTFTRQPSRT